MDNEQQHDHAEEAANRAELDRPDEGDIDAVAETSSGDPTEDEPFPEESAHDPREPMI